MHGSDDTFTGSARLWRSSGAIVGEWPGLVHVLDTQKEIDDDVLAVGLIDAVPTLLQVLCETTGMGFAAVARVTTGNWTACAVRDEINFGLKPGSQLELSTTLCCEVREARTPIVIDHVAEDSRYRDHQTPKRYGFESYVSVPIILTNGDYFGNLCAIDPKPHKVSDPKVVSMFTRFARLIASQIELKKVQETSHAALLSERGLGEMRELFVAILGHDLRKPLQNVAAALTKLEASFSPASAEVAVTSDIRAETQRMSFLIDELFDFTQARFGKGLPIRIEATDRLAAELNATIECIRLSNPQARIISNIVVQGSVRCDLNRIQQLLSVLLTNALEHGAPHGPISAVASLDDDKLVIEVWNDGEAIPIDDMKKVFEPHWRRGLYLCAQIAQAHDGTLGVMSRPGEGTLFTALIPA